MKVKFSHRDNCRLCSSRSLETVIKLDPIPLAEKYSIPGTAVEDDLYPIDVYMCRDCGHVQLLDVIDSEKLWDDYTYHSGQTKGIVEHFKSVAENLLTRFKPAPGSLVIDIGSNDGTLLRPFREQGYGVLGIDPAREIARKATESGIETIPELLSLELARKVREKYGRASVITAFNVFAHADDMNGMVESIRQMLAPDGVFVFEAQYLADIIDKMLLGTIFHEHKSHHSLKPLDKFLRRHRIELIDVERNNIQMGSIIGVAQLIGASRPVAPAVGAMLAMETERRLDQPDSVRQFAARLDRMRGQVKQLVQYWKLSGAKVAGYGAARSGPTLITQLGFGDSISVIFDDHPQKVHKLSPGQRIPVEPTSEMMALKPGLRGDSCLDPCEKNHRKQSKISRSGRSIRGLLP